jgi:metal-responsive CopG/Arc/MetJ family transcriptional regulator
MWVMKRITISVPEDLMAALHREARRRGVTLSQVAREAIEAHLSRGSGARRKLSFAGVARGSDRTTARDAEEILAREWEEDLIADSVNP